MTTRDEPWSPGTPCWVDLVVSDVDKAVEFYSALFGWDAQAGPPEAADYRMCRLNGRAVAGIGAGPHHVEMPAVWSTYLATSDADATARAVMENGGSLMLEPFGVLGLGVMAVGFDPSGSAFGMWEAGSHIGAGVVNEAGALTWNECMTRDYARSKTFYAAVFGHTFDEVGDGSFRYATISVRERVVAGIGELSPDMPGHVPSHWMTYFAADDVDASVGQATAMGGVLRTGPMDTPYGRMAVIEGPQGEVFSLITTSTGERPGPVGG
jgi:uncharacterized protein